MRLGTVLLATGRAVVMQALDGTILDLSDTLGTDLARALTDPRLVVGAEALDGQPLAGDDLRWAPPVPAPRRILCAGFNYRGHATEAGRDVPAHPTFFARFPSSVVGHGAALRLPVESETLDWEGEIAVVIGRPGRRIKPEDALDHVAGYSPFGDNSVREFQRHSTQATAGKNFDATGSWGPWLITADEVSDPRRLVVRTQVNDMQMQEGYLSDLVFTVPELIAYASSFTTLESGDIIVTGSPAGTGFRRDPPIYLRAGDRLTVEMVGYEALVNEVTPDG